MASRTNQGAAVEYEPQFCTTLRKNRPYWNVIQQDIRNLRASDFSGVDLLAAGVRAAVVAPEPELRRWFSWQWYWTDTLVDDLIRHRLREMFSPTRKSCYEEVLPLPSLEDAVDRVRRGRILLVVSPDSKMPPEQVQRFFEGLSQKNNLCVLTGERTALGNVECAYKPAIVPAGTNALPNRPSP